jgi:hypothetical protein
MTLHRDNFLVNKTNRRAEFQVYLVSQLYTFRAASLPIIRSSALYIGNSTLLQLRRPLATRGRMKPETCRVVIPNKLGAQCWNWYTIAAWRPLATRGRNHRAPGSKRSCTITDVQCRTPDDGQGSCPKRVELWYQINLELRASVGFIHKEKVIYVGCCCLLRVLAMCGFAVFIQLCLGLYWCTDLGRTPFVLLFLYLDVLLSVWCIYSNVAKSIIFWASNAMVSLKMV